MINRLNVKELRIGNYVYSDVYDIYTIVSINLKDVVGKRGKIKFEGIHRFIPIPLTEEWLLRLGFNKKRCQFTLSVGGESLDYFEHESGFILWYHGKRLGYAKEQIVRNQMNPNCLFYNTVHSLQNLFFALQGKELEVKEISHTQNIEQGAS
jgi:hypothetical protein